MLYTGNRNMENKVKFAVIKGSHYNLGYLCKGKQINCKNKMCKKFFCFFSRLVFFFCRLFFLYKIIS